MNSRQAAMMKKVIKGYANSDNIVNVLADSINKQLSRIEDKLGIRERHPAAATGLHSIRKLVSQENMTITGSITLKKRPLLV